ncbi:hypothetical protein [Micromonospora endophytica]|uniref:Uncharacterized protein n=1 Tax=Micromonospora endophytica TaxID=515350 RepID=A0A2W2CR48_9ACTN|nr:hypothetical protein [Micromonospora endophytica]PZG00391.1 hypothetical protein C1I93_02520 [Micromonospora endophytica]BCJ57318.1 hypothetical protein Jiend_07400 [Micromonospora endophytica]
MCRKDWSDYLGFKPSPQEHGVLDQLAAGKQVNVNSSLSARLLTTICTDPGDRFKDPIVLIGAHVAERLDLSGLRLKRALSFRDCRFDNGVDLSRAVCGETIEFIGCTIDGLTADNIHSCKDISAVDCDITGVSFADAHLEKDLRLTKSRLTHRPSCAAFYGPDMVIEGGLFLNHTKVTGNVTLDSSHIEHDLDCRAGHFGDDSPVAIDATNTFVGWELRCDERFHAEGEVRLCWARAGSVSFRNATLHNPNGLALRADSLRATIGCYLDQNLHATGGVRLVGAQIDGELSCSGGSFDGRGGVAIEAERLTAKDVYLDRGFVAHGTVRLVGAMLARQLTCTGGRFDNQSGSSLDATGLACQGSVYLDKDPNQETGFHANGQVRLCGASVAEAVVCTGGVFECEADTALAADGLTTEGDVMLNGDFRAVGGVNLARATVGRQLDCSGGSFQALGYAALNLSGVVGRGDVLLTNGFQATSEVSLRDADIARNVDLTKGHFTGIGDKSLDAYGLRVGGTLVLLPAEKPTQTVDLRYARVARLHDSEVAYPENRVELEGLTYESLESDLAYQQRIQILGRMHSYSRQPYLQLSKVYRDASKDEADREVAVAGLKQLRKRDKLRPHSKAWNFFMWATVRYGYRLYQPLLIALPLALLNIIFFHTAEHHGLMEPVGADTDDKPHTDATHCPENYPCFNPLAYSLQLLIPAINLYQIDKWVPDATKFWGTPLLFWTWFMIIVGWALGFALVAAITQAIRKE